MLIPSLHAVWLGAHTVTTYELHGGMCRCVTVKPRDLVVVLMYSCSGICTYECVPKCLRVCVIHTHRRNRHYCFTVVYLLKREIVKGSEKTGVTPHLQYFN